MEEMRGFTFWRSYYDSADKLRSNPELLSKFLMAILDYAFEDHGPIGDDPVLDALFECVRPSLDASKQKAKNGKQGGSKPKQTASKVEANESKAEANGSKPQAIRKKKEEKEVKKDSPTESTKKVRFADNVTMSNDEYQTLIATHGESDTRRMIEILDNYKGSSGKTYKSDYRAILSWVIDRLAEEKRKSGTPKQQTQYTGPDTSAVRASLERLRLLADE